MKESKLFRSLFSVTGILLLSKLAGFVKQMVTASILGATIETDLISLAHGLIGNIEYVLVQTLMTAFVATYIYEKGKGNALESRFASDTLKVFLLIAAAIVVAVQICAAWIARLIAPSYSQELSQRLAEYLRVFSPGLLLFVLVAVFRAILNANRRFVPGELVGFNQSVILIALLLIFGKTVGARTLVLAFFVYTIWNALFLGIQSRHYWKLCRGNPLKNSATIRMLRMMLPLLLGYSVIYINQQVDKILASGLEVGTVTAMSYGAVLSNLVATFIGTFGTILFTSLADYISQSYQERAAKLMLNSVSLMITIFLPVSLLTIVCSGDIVGVVFGHGAFQQQAVSKTALALMGYAFSFVPYVVSQMFSKFQYAYQDSKRPMINSTIGILCNIGLSILLCRRFGVFGITFASSVAEAINGVLNMVYSCRHNEYLRMLPLAKQCGFWIVGGALCVVAAKWGMKQFVGMSALLRFVLIVVFAGGAYLLVVCPLLYRMWQKHKHEKFGDKA